MIEKRNRRLRLAAERKQLLLKMHDTRQLQMRRSLKLSSRGFIKRALGVHAHGFRIWC
jgi:hypothetical protein